MQLLKDLAQEVQTPSLSKIVEAFKTDELSQETIDEEVEAVRQEMYDRKNQH